MSCEQSPLTQVSQDIHCQLNLCGNKRICYSNISGAYTYEAFGADLEAFPRTEEPVIILGKAYSTLYGKF